MARKSIYPGWTRVAAGHYRHDETGIEIKRSDAHREHGYAVGVRWNIWATWSMSRTFALVGSARTLRSAIEWAEGRYSFVELGRERIAEAWDEAHAEQDERAAFDQGYRWAERHHLPSGRREHIAAAIARDRTEALAEQAKRAEASAARCERAACVAAARAAAREAGIRPLPQVASHAATEHGDQEARIAAEARAIAASIPIDGRPDEVTGLLEAAELLNDERENLAALRHARKVYDELSHH
jgi:hypothetical protein